jgi:hypothetical protein
LALSSTSATIRTPYGGDVTVGLLPATSYVAVGPAAQKAGLKVGDQVVALGPARTQRARTLRYGARPLVVPGLVELTGTVRSAGKASLTLALQGGQTATVRVTPTTRFRLNGARVKTMPTFSSGVQVSVTATELTNGTLRAQVVAEPAGS